MPRYQITAPDGRVVVIEGDRPPTSTDAQRIFAGLPVDPNRRKAAERSGTEQDRELLQTTAGREELKKRADAGEPRARGSIGLLADIGIEAAGPMAGQSIGALAGPAAPVLVPLLGGIGGVGSNILAQNRRISAGEQTGFQPGQALASGVTGAIPGAPLAATGTRAVLREGAKQAVGGAIGRALETGVDEGRLPSAAELATVTALPAVGGALAQRVQAANPTVQAAVREAQTGTGAVARKTLDAARDAGYAIPPSLARKSVGVDTTVLGDTVESFGGKAATLQEAAVRNQKVTNSLAKKALGLPENRDITEEAIEGIRFDASKPYAAIEEMATTAGAELKDLLKKNQGMSTHETEALLATPGTAERRASLAVQAAADVDALRKARNTATGKFRQFKRSADPDHLAEAEAALETAAAIEQKIEDAAVEFGKPEMVDQLRVARTQIAKTYDVEKALNKANSNIDPQVLAAAYKAGRPLSGELETIARTALDFAPIMKEVTKVGAPGVSAFQVAGMLAGGLGGYGTIGPIGALAGAAPLARPAARSLALSDAFATRIPLSVDARPPVGALATRVLAQEAAQEIADEVEPKKKSEKK